MYVTAHRGFDDYYPENTVGAISRAARTDGVDAVEFESGGVGRANSS